MKSRTTSRIRNLAITAIAVGAVAFVPAASAGPLVATASNCDAQTLSQPFLPFADLASYTLDPGGDFESGPAWNLSGGAAVGGGNEPWSVGSASDSKSLALPSGSGAVSPSICVGIEHPTLRFFAKGSNPLAKLRVEVLFEDGFGNVQSLPIGVVTGSTGWAPTTIYPLVVNLLPLLPGEKTAVAFRFTPSGGSFQIDDVYVDPYCRG
jgi:hypothetical protein